MNDKTSKSVLFYCDLRHGTPFNSFNIESRMDACCDKRFIVVSRKANTTSLDTVISLGSIKKRFDSFVLVRASGFFQSLIRQQRDEGNQSYEISLTTDKKIDEKAFEAFLNLLNGKNEMVENDRIDDIKELASMCQVFWINFFIENSNKKKTKTEKEPKTAEELFEKKLIESTEEDPYEVFCEAREKYGKSAFLIFNYKNEKMNSSTAQKILSSIGINLILPIEYSGNTNKDSDAKQKVIEQLKNKNIDIINEDIDVQSSDNIIKIVQAAGKNYIIQNEYERTPTCYAALFNDIETVNKFIHNMKDSFNDQEYNELLCCAAISGNINIVKKILEQREVVSPKNVHDHCNRNPLHYSILAPLEKGNYTQIAKLLIEKGFSLFDEDNKGMTPLELLVEKGQSFIKQIFNNIVIPKTQFGSKNISKIRHRNSRDSDKDRNSSIVANAISDMIQKQNYDEALLFFDIACKLSISESTFTKISFSWGTMNQSIISILRDHYFNKQGDLKEREFLWSLVCKYDDDCDFIDDKFEDDSTIMNYLATQPGNGEVIKMVFKMSKDKNEIITAKGGKYNCSPIFEAIQIKDNDENVKSILECIRDIKSQVTPNLLTKIIENKNYNYLIYVYDILIDTNTCKEMINYENEAFINAITTDNSIASAIIYEHTKQQTIKDLYEAIRDPSLINKQNESGKTPLMIAIKYENEQLVKKLLAMNPSLDIKDGEGKTAFDYAKSCKTESITTLMGSFRKPEAKNPVNKSYQNLNYYSIKRSEAKTLVEKKDFDVNMIKIEGKTPLIIFTIKGFTEVVNALIEKGADIGAKDDDGKTAAFYAVQNSKVDVLKLLLSKWKPPFDVCSEIVNEAACRQADIMPAIYEGVSQYYNIEELKIIFTSTPEMNGNTPIHYAAQKGFTHHINFILSKFNVDINAMNAKGQTPLHKAAISNKAETVKMLISLPQTDPNIKEGKGKTPLYCATENRNAEIVKILLTSPSIDPNIGVETEHGPQTPLLKAVFSGNQDIARLLLSDERVDPEIKFQNRNARDNIEIAKIDNKEQMKQIFIEFYLDKKSSRNIRRH